MKSIIAILFFFFGVQVNAQLIPNGNMEEEFNCRPKNWETITGWIHLVSKSTSTCFYDQISNNILKTIPNGNQALMLHGGLHLHGETAGRELTNKLVKGRKYRLSFSATYENLIPNDNGNRILVTAFGKDRPSRFSGNPYIGDLYKDTLTLSRQEKWIRHSYCFEVTDDTVNYFSIGTIISNQQNRSNLFIDSIVLNYDTLNVDLGKDTILCKGDTITYNVSNEYAEYYLWQSFGLFPTFKSTYSITKSGTYWVGIQDNCYFDSDTIVIKDPPSPNIFLGLDSSLCIGDTLDLKADYPKASYLWQDESINSTYKVTKDGEYWVQITDVCDSTASDTISILFDNLPSIDLGADTTLCKSDSLSIKLDNENVSYLWQDSSTLPNFTIHKKGTYWVEVKDKCGASSDTLNVNNYSTPEINSIESPDASLLAVHKPKASHYQWIYCDSINIPNATDPNYIALSTGNYAVIEEINGCSDTSNCISVGIEEITLNKLALYPNPTNGSIFIEWSEPFNNIEIVIRNALGQLISKKRFLPSTTLNFDIYGASGSYVIEVTIDERDIEYFKVIKQ